MVNALVVSTFEGGYQPLTAISGATALSNAGADVDFLDVYVEGAVLERVRDRDVVAISVPLYDSLMTGIHVASDIRAINPGVKVVFFGQYATINAGRLSGKYGDMTIVGEWEIPLAEMVKFLREGCEPRHPAIIDAQQAATGLIPHPFRSRDHFRIPARSIAPPLSKYPQRHLDKLLGGSQIVGGLELTRGCHHKCTYCSVYAAYDGKVFMVDDDIVLADVRNLVDQGMTHLTFIDADFFNTRKQCVVILKRIHEAFPHLTFDFTTRVDHILEQREILGDLARYGVRCITSALEFPKQEVLDQVYKEMTITMIEKSIAELRRAGITLNPTFIMFNPWVSLDDIATLHDFVTRNQLEDVIEPIQYETRLHLYKSSPLLQNPTIQALELIEYEFHFDWKHPDPRVDELYHASITPPEEGIFKRCCLKC